MLLVESADADIRIFGQIRCGNIKCVMQCKAISTTRFSDHLRHVVKNSEVMQSTKLLQIARTFHVCLSGHNPDRRRARVKFIGSLRNFINIAHIDSKLSLK